MLLYIYIGENFVILVCVVLTQCQHVMDRQTDGQLCLNCRDSWARPRGAQLQLGVLFMERLRPEPLQR